MRKYILATTIVIAFFVVGSAMAQTDPTPDTSRKVTPTVTPAYQGNPTATPIGVYKVVMLDPLVWIDPPMLEAVRSELAGAGRSGYFIVTGFNMVGDLAMISVAQTSKPDKVNLEIDGIWLGLVVVVAPIQTDGRANIISGAVEGQEEFNNIIQSSRLSSQAKNDLAPAMMAPDAVPTMEYSYIFPWQKDKTNNYGPLGVHNVGGAWDPTIWRAVDFVSNGEGSMAPNALYASTSGTVSYICADGTQVGLKIRRDGIDKQFWLHLVPDPRYQVGMSVSRGSMLGPMITGDNDTSCGYTIQGEGVWHVHFGFRLNLLGPCYYQLEKWCLRYSDGHWIDLENGDVVAENGSLTALWSGWGGDPLPEYKTIWDLLLKSMVGMVNDTANSLPAHENMNMAGTVVASAGIAIDTIYMLILANFSMTIPLACLGIGMLGELIRAIYAVWKFLKSAIPFLG